MYFPTSFIIKKEKFEPSLMQIPQKIKSVFIFDPIRSLPKGGKYYSM